MADRWALGASFSNDTWVNGDVDELVEMVSGVVREARQAESWATSEGDRGGVTQRYDSAGRTVWFVLQREPEPMGDTDLGG